MVGKIQMNCMKIQPNWLIAMEVEESMSWILHYSLENIDLAFWDSPANTGTSIEYIYQMQEALI